jgi:hypothetical protein
MTFPWLMGLGLLNPPFPVVRDSSGFVSRELAESIDLSGPLPWAPDFPTHSYRVGPRRLDRSKSKAARKARRKNRKR